MKKEKVFEDLILLAATAMVFGGLAFVAHVVYR